MRDAAEPDGNRRYDVSRDRAVALAPSQENLWEVMTGLSPDDPGGARVVVGDTRLFHGPLDAAALRAAVDDVVRRHEVLRLAFERVAHDPLVRVEPDVDTPLSVVDLDGLAEDEQWACIGRIVSRARCRRFDLRRAPLWEATLARLDATRHVLTVCFFHMLSDGWSCRVFFDDVVHAYRQRTGADVAPRDDAPSLQEISDMQRASLTDVPHKLAYLRRALRPPATHVRFPVDELADDADLTADARAPFAFAPETVDGLRRVAWRARTTPFVVLMAACHTMTSLRTGDERVVVGTTTDGRDTARARAAIAQFTNNVYVPAEIRRDATLGDVVRTVHDATVEATTNVSSFQCLARAVNPDFDASRPWPDTHLFDIWFQAAAPDLPDTELGDLRVEQVWVQGRRDARERPRLVAADVPADRLPTWIKRGSPNVIVREDRRGGAVLYKEAIFAPDFIAELVADYVSIVDAFVRDPGMEVGALASASRPRVEVGRRMRTEVPAC